MTNSNSKPILGHYIEGSEDVDLCILECILLFRTLDIETMKFIPKSRMRFQAHQPHAQHFQSM